MISGFRHRGLKRLFERGDRSRVGADMLDKVENILAVLNRAGRPEDMDLPGFRLHPLKGDRAGQWAVTVRANWRIVFRFEGGNATDVDLTDYHQEEPPCACTPPRTPAGSSGRSASNPSA